ncbi:MAG: hypothetical protein ABSD88_07090 [Candidatus Korobacteraceae bacterium]|jgi:hypothetical protein
MSENTLEQIVSALRSCGASWYPQHGELRNIRVVGHTPKNDHYIYDVVMDFAGASERLAAKVFRGNRHGLQSPRSMAAQELKNLRLVHEICVRKKLSGVPRPLGDFSEAGAIVTEKLPGTPLQSIVMKAALLPGYADRGTLGFAARSAGEWLRRFHKATADMPEPFDAAALLCELEKLCAGCKGEGLDDLSIRNILNGAKTILARSRKALPSSAVLNDFTPLNAIVGESGVGFCEFGKMTRRGCSFHDVAQFLASVEALEKYPFCDRAITAEVQESFLEAYGASAGEQQLLRVLRMKALLTMLVQGRNGKESALRKKVMWANVMKRFIQQAAERSLARAS